MSTSHTAPDDLKKIACDTINKSARDLGAVSKAIWENPELKYEEHFAHKFLTDFFEKRSFPIERNFVVQTGFRSVYGQLDNPGNLPNLAVLCEYDALPEIGHACGHNLIAEVGVAAALGIKAALDVAKDAGKNLGTLTVLGCPAEEGAGGKVDFIRARTFDNVDCALMAHPLNLSVSRPLGFIARALCEVTYRGKASHAAAFPWEGVNALDAAVMAYSSVSLLRQQMKPTWRVHGVIKNGGTKPNIIPEISVLEYYIRAPTVKELSTLKEKVQACFQAAASATGCSVDIVWGDKPYDNLINNNTLATRYEQNALTLGFDPRSPSDLAVQTVASTDMGNVSQVVPSIHPCFYIGGDAFNHTRPFTALAGDDKAQPYTLDVAKALAMTAIDIYCQPSLLTTMKAELREDLLK